MALLQSQVLESLFSSLLDADGMEQADSWLRKVPFLYFGQNTNSPADDKSNGDVRCPFEFTLHKKSYYGKHKAN